ncbi:unnamed protein product [Schistosoma margrebowiei]|uniref:Uncharacterized protein n=1 Tax=Schistosoma margrebowiei TaxID=48269 RepID=A0A183MK15_9TREM|nr:unnamed protein product [Schistosoma margrebowiei]
MAFEADGTEFKSWSEYQPCDAGLLVVDIINKPYNNLQSTFDNQFRVSCDRYLRSQLSYGRMDRESSKDLRRDNSDIFDCHTLTEPIHKLLTNSKVKQEISKSLDFGKKIKPNYTSVGNIKLHTGLHPTNCNKNKVKRKVPTIKTPKSCSNININTNDCLIIKSKNALNQSCSISTRLNLTEINESNSDFVNLENNISVCLKIQGSPRKTTSLYTKQKSSLSENDIVKVVSPRLSNQYKYPRTQKSYENILSSGRAYSISSISAERIKGILEDKLCVYGYQTGKTPRTSDFHELDDIPENQLHTLSYCNNNKQLKVSHKTSARPKSAGDAHIGIHSIEDIKELLNIQSIDTPPKPFLLSERQPNRIRSAREYRRKHIERNFRSCLNSTDNLSLRNNDTSVSDGTTTNSVHSARQRADIHLPSVKHLIETYEEVEK